MEKRDVDVILTSAMPPAPFDEPPKPATTIKGAIRNLERESELLLLEARGYFPFHGTLQDLAERLR